MTDSTYDSYETSGAGWKLFAGIMIIIVGTFNVIDGLVAITNANQFKGAFGSSSELPVTNNVKTWGWVVLILGAILILVRVPDLHRQHVRPGDRRDRGECERDRAARVPAALPPVVVHHDPGRHPGDLGHRRARRSPVRRRLSLLQRRAGAGFRVGAGGAMPE